MSTRSPTTADAGNIRARQLVDVNPASFLNPLIGTSAAETCTKTEPVIALLHELFDRNLVSEDMHPGIAKVVQTVWAAMQYERDIAEQSMSNTGVTP